MYIHTNDKPYVCEICKMTFSESCALKKLHMRVHTKEKPYVCEISKRYNVQPLRHGKRHGDWSSPCWSVNVQNNQLFGCLKDHCVKDSDCLNKPGPPNVCLSGKHWLKHFYVDCLVLAVKHGGGSVMGPLIASREMIIGNHHQSILADHLLPYALESLSTRTSCVPLFSCSSYVPSRLHDHNDEVEHLICFPSHLI
ncbi:hypothetical protein TNCV_2220761 [Trichonephila clavipes]|nr:hypothetical protein TNCV_2220761 [Trichonephila clavipes]